MKLVRSLSIWVLAALALGLVLGAGARTVDAPAVRALVEGIEAVGGLWLNLLRMTVVPLVFAVLVTAIAGVADAAATGRLAGRAMLWFAGLLTVAALFSLAVTHGLLALWPFDPQGAQALRAGAGPQGPPAAAPGFADWLRSLAPANPVRAAAEDAILPLVVFAIFTGFAITRLAPERNRLLVQVFGGLADAMIVIVRWVLLAAPVGVFALGLGVGLRTGFGSAEVLAHYVVVVSLATLSVGVFAWVLAVAVGGVPLGRWARATAPVLATAFATQSSLACLPAMIERSRDDLKIPSRVCDLVLPLAVAVFRLTSPAANLAVAVALAAIYGLEPTPLQYAGAVAVALAVSLAAVGLPGQVSFFASVAPICLALGLPLELLPILLAVEVIPDIFRTVGNVSGDMAVTAIVAREKKAPAAAPALP